MPNKVKNLTWHACWNTMPTKASLVQRTIIEDPLCDCCHETPLHALWLCKEVDTIWDDSELWSYRRQIQFLSFKELLSWIILQKNNAELFVISKKSCLSEDSEPICHCSSLNCTTVQRQVCWVPSLPSNTDSNTEWETCTNQEILESSSSRHGEDQFQ